MDLLLLFSTAQPCCSVRFTLNQDSLMGFPSSLQAGLRKHQPIHVAMTGLCLPANSKNLGCCERLRGAGWYGGFRCYMMEHRGDLGGGLCWYAVLSMLLSICCLLLHHLITVWRQGFLLPIRCSTSQQWPLPDDHSRMTAHIHSDVYLTFPCHFPVHYPTNVNDEMEY